MRPPTGPPVYGRACSSQGLPRPGSAITTRPNHPLPRQDFHLQACPRLKAAHRNVLFARLPVLSGARVRENWFSGLTKHGAKLPERDPGCQRPISAFFREGPGLGWRAVNWFGQAQGRDRTGSNRGGHSSGRRYADSSNSSGKCAFATCYRSSIHRPESRIGPAMERAAVKLTNWC